MTLVDQMLHASFLNSRSLKESVDWPLLNGFAARTPAGECRHIHLGEDIMIGINVCAASLPTVSRW
ncbi:hypothetical protein ACIBEJ_48105 [Nonomuraea sp. NPDC050790]|uniref:hypothetical protein n=1 Tax=Nonomuraea sp. NPDC050790 TaxID=3364371 RepID=UPI0037ADE115